MTCLLNATHARATSPGGARPSPREGALVMSVTAQLSVGAFEINRQPQSLRRAHPGSGVALCAYEALK